MFDFPLILMHTSIVFNQWLIFSKIIFMSGQLLKLGVNLKNFPTSSAPATFAILFHVGIAAVLGLYVLFWVKVRFLVLHICSFYFYLLNFVTICIIFLVQLDLFTTLKALSLLGVFLMFVGHRILSHLASVSSKLKSAWEWRNIRFNTCDFQEMKFEICCSSKEIWMDSSSFVGLVSNCFVSIVENFRAQIW